MTVPAPYAGVANGVLTSSHDAGKERRFVWDMRQPMTPHLVTVHVNKFYGKFGRTLSGKPVSVFSTRSTPQADVDNYLLAAKMIDYFERLVGPYPFEGYGSVVVDDPFLSSALPTQAMATFPLGSADEGLVAHQVAHQWFGGSVSFARWADHWLAEGFATYFEVLWRHRDDPIGFDAAMRELHGYVAARKIGPAAIDSPDDLFSERVSLRGAAALYALRLKVGDPTFFMILRRFAFEFAGRSASSADFIRTAVSVSDNIYVAELMHAWLYRKPVPSIAGVPSRAKPRRPTSTALRCRAESAHNVGSPLRLTRSPLSPTTRAGKNIFPSAHEPLGCRQGRGGQHVAFVESSLARLGREPCRWIRPRHRSVLSDLRQQRHRCPPLRPRSRRDAGRPAGSTRRRTFSSSRRSG